MLVTHRVLAAVLVISASCARQPASTESDPRTSTNPNVISREELQNPVIRGMDAERAIRYLRPTFFRNAGPLSYGTPAAGLVHVSVDFGPVQPTSQLAFFPPLALASLFEIRYLDANEAQNRFGITANGGPVIVLVSNKQ